MHIIVVGADHTTASIALRERLACSPRQIPPLLALAREVTLECVLLSTCNRIEFYAVCSDEKQGRAELLRLLCEQRNVAQDELAEHCYTLIDEQAVEHLFGVASGLYSLVPGEPQIQGQVGEALEIAQGGGYCGPILSALFRSALVVGKRARSETSISRNAASVSHVAVQLARHLFPSIQDAQVLLVGSGQMSELAAKNMRSNGARQLVIINRTLAHAVDLAQTLGATHRPFTELADALIEADVVISSTTASRTIITMELMQRVVEQRAGRSLLLIDIALPRDIDPAVALLPGIHLYNLDDLQAEVDRGIALRLQEVEHVRAIIAEEAVSFQRWLASLSVVDTISDLRLHADLLRQQELARTLRQISHTLSEREVAAVQELTTRLMNKLLHTPTLKLKDAAASGQGHVYAEAMRYLFDLENEHETNNSGHTSEQARNDTDPLGDRAATSALAQS
ncbi:MAG: glutamyl-tRNA reductase [Ktedonobacteraceae bacterium]|nr:glutamyl-tRNA reductase [Ktedonobacteraceae bacterium]MBV9614495.1 glutamyl-tRNA reductase [Ktedonobacteraceae bacterium]